MLNSKVLFLITASLFSFYIGYKLKIRRKRINLVFSFVVLIGMLNGLLALYFLNTSKQIFAYYYFLGFIVFICLAFGLLTGKRN